MTSVVDLHKKNGIRPKFDIYIGRAVRNTEFHVDSKWANPFHVKTYGLQKSLQLYEQMIWGRLSDPHWINELGKLIGKKLGCWCITTNKILPCKCHGQILMKIIREYFGDKGLIY